MAEHQVGGAKGVEALQVHAGAVLAGLVEVGVEAGVVGHRPVHRTAVLQLIAHFPRRQAENHPWVQQVVDRGTGGDRTGGLFIPVAEQLGFAPGEQVVAPTVIDVAPVAGFVHQLLGGADGLAVLDQAHFHFIDAAGQGTRVQCLQTGRDRLGVDQQAVAVDLHGGLAIGGDVDRVDTGLGVVDGQAVGAAVHDAQRRIGAGAKAAQLTGQAIGVGGEMAEAQELPFQFTLGIQLVDRMAHLLFVATLARQLQIEHLGPVAQAGTGLQPITPAEVFVLAAVEVELVVDDQATTATFGLLVKARGIAGTFDVLGDDRQQRAFQVVVHGHQLLRAGLGAGAKGDALLQHRLPGVAGGGGDLAATGVGKLQQRHTLVLGQHNQRLTQRLLIQFDLYRQGHIEEMVAEPGRQTLGLGQQTGRRDSAWRGCGQGTRTNH